MAGRTVCIRVNSLEWESLKEVANTCGMSRNSLINLFIHSVVIGKTQIEQKNNIMNVNVNLIPINNSNTSVLINQTKSMKNELILEEIRRMINVAYNAINSKYNRNGTVPFEVKDRLKKLINKASFLPQDLFEEAKKIILT